MITEPMVTRRVTIVAVFNIIAFVPGRISTILSDIFSLHISVIKIDLGH